MAQDPGADVIVAGGGLPGLSLATALAQALGPDVAIRVHDPAFAKPGRESGRAYAIAAGGCRLFEALGVWERLAPGAQPITEMIVTDSRSGEPVKPRFLAFAGEAAAGEPFAHMLRESAMLDALTDAARAAGVRLSPTTVTAARPEGARMRVETGEGPVLTPLLVASDGRRSPLRSAAGIPFYGWGYGQSGIVVTVAHERPHGGRAEEHFLEHGPFAILPLRGADGSGRESSIVWTARAAEAKRICALAAGDFQALLTERFGRHLGPIRVLGRPQAAPLAAGLARRFHAERLALIGDAAHGIHPIAGQGLNLGLKDAAALAEGVAAALRLGLDHGAADVLRAYDAARRFDTARMLATTDVLNRLFSNDAPPLRALRDFGLGLVDRLPPLKQFFIREAAGVSPQAPRLMRGEAL